MFDTGIRRLSNRALIRVVGRDAFKFLQNLITNDLDVDHPALVYSALLTPQGKYLFDFFVIKKSETIFIIDISSHSKESFIKHLSLYKLRADVNVEEVDGWIGVGSKEIPDVAFIDPRNKQLGWRKYFFETNYPEDIPSFDQQSYDLLRVRNGIPESGVELIKNKTFILEVGFERLAGVSFTKGCYVGQEVTARMRHKTELQKGLVKVKMISKMTETTRDIVSDNRVVGTIFTRVNEDAIAYLKFKYEKLPLNVGTSKIIDVERF